MEIRAVRTRVFKEHEELISFIVHHVRTIPDRSVLVVTSKIVALSEGRTRIIKTEREKAKLIREESQWAMKTKYVWLTIKDNLVMASAGVDASNGRGKLILLPKDSYKSSEVIRKALMKHYRIRHLGIIISDSRLIPLRSGTVGVAIAYAGFRGIKSYKGRPDIFGRIMQFQRSDIADALATAAVLTMGEGKERQPLALIQKPPIQFTDRTDKKELRINIREDVYQPLFAKIKKIKFR